MNDGLRAHGEARRLAALLGADEAQVLDLVGDLPPGAIRALRERTVAVLHDAEGDRLRGIAAAAGLLPAPVAASLAERAMGPVLCALLAGTVDRRRTADIARRLPDPFLAEVAVHLDPRRVADVVASLPPARVAAVARELTARGEFVTMAQFVDHLSDDALAAAVDAIGDEALLRTAFVVDEPGRVDAVVAGLPDERLAGLLAAARGAQLWFEAIALVAELDPEQQARLARLAVDADVALVEELAAVAHERGLWPVVLPLVATLDPERRRTVARRPWFHRAAVLDAIVAAAAEAQLWGDLLPLVAELPPRAQRRVAARVAELEPAVVQAAIAAATEAGLAEGVLQLLLAMSEPDRERAIGSALDGPARGRGWVHLLPLLPLLPPRARAVVAAQAAALSDRDLAALVRSVDADGLWEPWLQVVAELGPATQDRLRAPLDRVPKRVLRTLGGRADGLGLAGRLGPLHDLLDAYRDELDHQRDRRA